MKPCFNGLTIDRTSPISFIFLELLKMIREQFFIRLEKNRWYTYKTVDIYRRCLKAFDNYLIQKRKRSIDDCEKIHLLDVEWFYRDLSNWWRCIKTCNIYLSSIKTYLRYCSIMWKKVINESSILRAKEPEKKVDCLSDDDSTKLLNYFKNLESNTKKWEIINKRNYCICWLLLYTWLRVSELANLKRNQISSYFQIIWKGNKVRLVNLFDDDLKVVNDYLKLRKDNIEDLFISFDNAYANHKLTTQYIEALIKKWWEKAWLSERVRPHKLRHTFATNLLRSWAKLEHIQKLLGHSSIATTEIYLTVLDSECRWSQSRIKRF